ncbi:hypothetical protein INO13_14050 [Staphylococcus aureus]|nr:hypothetical protein [Staphylococcus aureus]
MGTYFDIDTEDVTFSEADVYKGQLLTSSIHSKSPTMTSMFDNIISTVSSEK